MQIDYQYIKDDLQNKINQRWKQIPVLDSKRHDSFNKDLDTYDKARYQNVIDGMQNTDALSEVKALANHMHAQSDSTYWIEIPSLGLKSTSILANTLDLP